MTTTTHQMGPVARKKVPVVCNDCFCCYYTTDYTGNCDLCNGDSLKVVSEERAMGLVKSALELDKVR